MKKITYYIILSICYVISIIPLWIHHLTSDMVSWIACRFKLYRYNVVHDNLTSSFPEKSEREIRSIIREYYRHLVDCLFESLKLLTISDKALDRRVQVLDFDCMKPDVDAGHPIILYMGHFGNWEWIPCITHHFTKPEITAQIYRPLRDGISERITAKIRNRFGALNIAQNQAFRTLLKLKHEGKQTITGFIADQRPNSDNLNHWMMFLNHDTAYAVGGEEIGRRIDAAFYYIDIEKTGRSRYRLRLKPITPLDGYSYPYTASFMTMLEQTIRRQPPYWLWSHKRWKAKRPQNIKLEK